MLPVNLHLPPANLRFMNEDDEKFLRIGSENLQLLRRYGFNADSAIPDLGSGYGRLAYAILGEMDFRGKYLGLDLLQAQIRWCQQNITVRHPQFQFDLINVLNDRYNPISAQRAELFRFALSDESFDFSALFSVFTHMYDVEIQRYLLEIYRMLRPGACGVATFFLFDPLRLELLAHRRSGLTMHYELNDHTRLHNPPDKLHAIAFDRRWTEQLMERNNFDVLEI